MTKLEQCSENISVISAIVFFFGFLFALFCLIPASQALIPKVNVLRNDTMEWEFKGQQATLRAMKVPGSPIIGEATATQKGDVIELKDAVGKVEEISRHKLPHPDSPRYLYQWKHQGADVAMVDMTDVQRIKAQRVERTFKEQAYERSRQDVTNLSQDMRLLLTMMYHYQVRGY